jgi:hypothetical protein
VLHSVQVGTTWRRPGGGGYPLSHRHPRRRLHRLHPKTHSVKPIEPACNLPFCPQHCRLHCLLPLSHPFCISIDDTSEMPASNPSRFSVRHSKVEPTPTPPPHGLQQLRYTLPLLLTLACHDRSHLSGFRGIGHLVGCMCQPAGPQSQGDRPHLWLPSRPEHGRRLGDGTIGHGHGGHIVCHNLAHHGN